MPDPTYTPDPLTLRLAALEAENARLVALVRDAEALARAVRATSEIGEPTEDEAIFWRFEGPFVDGWAASVVFDHHDGEIDLAHGAGATLDDAVSGALHDWRTPRHA